MALLLQLPTRAGAQASPATLTEARVSKGLDALPGVYEVPLALPSARGIAARGGVGYGWTEDVLGLDDSHHRLQLDVGASFTPNRWLSTSVRLLGRYDAHSASTFGSDDGIVTETHVGARSAWSLGRGWHAGGQVALWLPGGDSVSKAFAAISGSADLLLSQRPDTIPLSLGLVLGLHANRARYAGGALDQYSAADRLALGASDSILALRTGLAVTYRTGALEWIAEWAYRMYFSYPGRSPMWLRAGARYHASDQLQLEALLGVSPSRRPTPAAQDAQDAQAPLEVVEPRVWAGLALTYTWPEATPRPVTAAPQRTAPPPAPTAPAAPARVQGRVLAPGGAELAGASVSLRQAVASAQQRPAMAAPPPAADVAHAQATTGGDGSFHFDALQASVEYALTVRAEGFKPYELSLVLDAGERRALSVELERELPIGQVRGTVRRFNGAPIAASVRILELDTTHATQADGSFEIDVPPGDYTVSVSAPGFRPQTRTAHVDLRGVAILIVELEPTR